MGAPKGGNAASIPFLAHRRLFARSASLSVRSTRCSTTDNYRTFRVISDWLKMEGYERARR